MDQSITLNKKDKLNVPQQDRLEEAWKRTMLDWGSKREVRLKCSVSDGVIGHMRRVKAQAQSPDADGKLFRERLHVTSPAQALGILMEKTWSMTKLTHLGLDKKDFSDETRAARLARLINSKLTNTLSREPGITARALRLYDPELPEKLIEAWRNPGVAEGIEREEQDAEAETHKLEAGTDKLLRGSDTALRMQLESYKAEVDKIEAELARREAGWTSSDDTWNEWVRGGTAE